METTYQESKNQLMNDFNTAVADAEELLTATMDVGVEKVATIRAKAEESLNIAKARMAEAQTALLTKTKEAAKATDAYVHENPWRSVGFAASIGVVIGLLIGRR